MERESAGQRMREKDRKMEDKNARMKKRRKEDDTRVKERL